MKLLRFIPAILLTVVASCTSYDKFSVNVNLDNAEGKTVYLGKTVDGKFTAIDSAKIVNGSAVLCSAFDENYMRYGISCKGWRRPCMFFADNSDVLIEGDYLKYYELQVKASQSQNRLNEFEKNFNGFDEKLEEIYEKMSHETNDSILQELKAQFEKTQDDQNYYLFDQVWDNNADFVSHYILYRYKWAMQPCELRHVRNNFDSTVYSPYLPMLDAYIAKLDKVEEGMMFTDFTQLDVNGNEVKLSDFVGKSELLLVDFWASWCGDCRKENPSVVSVYNDFHQKGFDILSVSLDNDKDNWQAAIAADHLVWNNHVTDLKGWNNAASDIYAVVAIPSNVLLDKNGIIVAKNLMGDDLRSFVANRLEQKQ